jgi:hypothetical protein
MGEYKLGRGIDYLGSIARMLRDLSGFATLIYELLQNADDAPGATTARFDITPEALIVWNDGQFSDCGSQDLHPDQCPWLADQGERCDFHRFRSVSAGDKGRRADLTGAFGIGFTAVYQITDQPEIISSGQHWIIDETQPEEERIRVHARCSTCHGETGTRFILPWARDPNSDFRQRTNAPPVDGNDEVELAEVLDRVLPTAMLFLRHIRRVVLLKDSQLRKDVVREDDGEDTLVSDGETDQLWRILSGDFGPEANELRLRYPAKLEKSSDVAVAVPFGVDLDGLLCAYLPTDERTGLPFHVNADFFLASDRKRLVVEGYQGEWNRAAVRKAAQLLAERLLDLRDVCRARQLWSLFVDAHQAGTNPTVRSRDLALEAFWDVLEPKLGTAPILLSTEDEWVSPETASIVRDPDEEAAAQILAPLGGVFAHPQLREFCFRLPYERALGLSQLRIGGMVDLLVRNGLDRRTEVEALPGPLRNEGAREILLRELDVLLGRAPEESRRRGEEIGRVALAPGADGAVWPWADTFRADQRTRNLFEPFAHDSVFIDEKQLPSDLAYIAVLSPSFEAPDAISWLDGHEDEEIAQLLGDGSVDVVELLEWFEAHKNQFIEDGDLTAQLAQVALFPTRTGFQPLSEVALPGDFVDELGLADIVDVGRLGDALPLLKRLGARPLTFASYVTEFVPRAVALHLGDPDRWWKLILLMAEKLGQIEDDPAVQQALAHVPCVRTVEGGFEKPSEVYFASDLVTGILGEYPSAFLPTVHPRSVEAFYTWVGVAARPRTHDVLEQVRRLTAEAPTRSSSNVIANVIEYLAIELEGKRRAEWGQFGALAGMKWLPARGEVASWFAPQELYTTFQDYLFVTQAQFIGISAAIQGGAASFLKELGVRSIPSTEQIVSHLLHCSDSGATVNQEIYAVLNQRVEDPEIDRLIGRRSVLLPSETWVSPHYVFWGGHPFGRFRATLGTDFQRFAPLLSRLGVREHPTSEDAAAVLLEMANEFGGTNTPVENEDDVRVYVACWQMLDPVIDEEDADVQTFERLQKRKTIRDPRGVLNVPDRIFFDDVPGLAERFPKELGSYLIRRPEGAWRAMRAAGVRDLSRAVTTRMLELGEREMYQSLRSVLRARMHQIGRVLDPFDSTWPSHIGDTIEALEVVCATRLVVEYSLEAFRMTAPPADLEALFLPDDGVLYVSRSGEPNWLGIARELARAIAPDTPPGSLAANLALVLSAPSDEVADRRLDEAWVPRLEPSLEGTATTSVVETFGGEEAPTAEREEPSSPDRAYGELGPAEVGVGSEQDSRAESAGGGSGSTEAESDAGSRLVATGDGQAMTGQSRETARSRLRSYVMPAVDAATDVEAGAGSDADSVTDRAGVDRVLKFERDSGRTPIEKAHEFPGYDIESLDERGNIERYIEVKSLSGTWDSYGVSVSPRQLSEARQLGESYWLYVVARAPRADFNIYCIRNPAARIDQYMFDDAWIGVGQTSVAGRAIPPVPITEAESRLPGRSYLPFYDIPSQEPGSVGAEAGWVEWMAGASPGSYLVQVLGDALKPVASRGMLVVVEPMNAVVPEPGDRLFLDLGGQTDPETGTDLAFRIWPAETPERTGSLELLALNSAVPALVVQDAQLVTVLGRLKTDEAASATERRG